MQEELITIIVPIYNVEKFLPNCIESLIHQTYQNLEILLIDDGSTDSCKEISDEYAKKYSNIFAYHKENGGLSDARNYGVSKAKGKYICFVDSDDYVNEKYCEVLYKNIINANADISICGFLRVSDTCVKEECIYEDEEVKLYEKNIDKQRNILNELNEKTTVAWNKLYRKEVWNEFKYPVGKLNEDEFVIHHILDKCGKVIYTNLKLYYYYQRPNSIMNSKYNEKRLDVVEAFCNRLNFYKNKKQYNELVPRAYVVFMKMIIEHHKLAKESNKVNICNMMITRYNREYDKTINKVLENKDKLQLMLFYHYPNMYYLVKKGINNARRGFRKNTTKA